MHFNNTLPYKYDWDMKHYSNNVFDIFTTVIFGTFEAVYNLFLYKSYIICFENIYFMKIHIINTSELQGLS